MVKVTLSAVLVSSVAGIYPFMALAATGANAISPSDDRSVHMGSITNWAEVSTSATFLLTGLAPGATDFFALYKIEGAGGSAYFQKRCILVEPVT
jgi:hypothetical protein